jgi:SAM-dependent methyltransferase
MPHADGTFDRVLSVNTIYFWEDPRADIRAVRRILKSGGRFVLVFRGSEGEGGAMEVHGMSHPTAVADVVGWMDAAGFTDMAERTREAPFGPETITAVALTGTATS